MTKSASKTWQSKAAWIIVTLLFLGIFADVMRHPNSHTTMPTYRLAATQWWAATDVYSLREHDGFYYFPQAAVIFTPFNLLPGLWGDFAWRAFTFGLFLYALVRLKRFFLDAHHATPAKTLLLLFLFAVPSSMASLRNAQFDLPLAAVIVLIAAEISAARWTVAAAWLCFAISLKPLTAVPLLLFTALYWKLIPRVAVGILVILALPFLHWNLAYVAHEYYRCFETLIHASKANEPRYSDLAALLSKTGYVAPDELKTAVRIFFALVYLGLGALAVKRLGKVEAAWTVGALSADYLMLFNPRTETCSYVFLGPFIASAALWSMAQGQRWLGYVLAFGAIGLACDGFPKIETHAFVFSVHDMTDRWLKPLIALLFAPVLVGFILGKKKGKF